MDNLPLDRDVLCPCDYPLDGNHLHHSLWDNLRDILLEVFYGVIVDLGNFSGYGFHVSSLFVFSDSSLSGNSLDVFSHFIVSDSLFKGDILNPALPLDDLGCGNCSRHILGCCWLNNVISGGGRLDDVVGSGSRLHDILSLVCGRSGSRVDSASLLDCLILLSGILCCTVGGSGRVTLSVGSLAWECPYQLAVIGSSCSRNHGLYLIFKPQGLFRFKLEIKSYQ